MKKSAKDQMTKLNGTDDLTLVSFCMTLSDPVEIRQYLTAYLGSTPQVELIAPNDATWRYRKGTSEASNPPPCTMIVPVAGSNSCRKFAPSSLEAAGVMRRQPSLSSRPCSS